MRCFHRSEGPLQKNFLQIKVEEDLKFLLHKLRSNIPKSSAKQRRTGFSHDEPASLRWPSTLVEISQNVLQNLPIILPQIPQITTKMRTFLGNLYMLRQWWKSIIHVNGRTKVSMAVTSVSWHEWLRIDVSGWSSWERLWNISTLTQLFEHFPVIVVNGHSHLFTVWKVKQNKKKPKIYSYYTP